MGSSDHVIGKGPAAAPAVPRDVGINKKITPLRAKTQYHFSILQKSLETSGVLLQLFAGQWNE
jgi:hypothetical protein